VYRRTAIGVAVELDRETGWANMLRMKGIGRGLVVMGLVIELNAGLSVHGAGQWGVLGLALMLFGAVLILCSKSKT
jgi:hypothetical protein